jgi:hypothetical protein
MVNRCMAREERRHGIVSSLGHFRPSFAAEHPISVELIDNDDGKDEA